LPILDLASFVRIVASICESVRGATRFVVVDRLLVVSGVIVCWKFDLLPRWALAVLAARELFMLFASRFALRHGLDLEIKMLGRWAVWPTMFSLFLAMVSTTWVADVLLYIGLAMTLATTVEYVVDARKQWKKKVKPSTSA